MASESKGSWLVIASKVFVVGVLGVVLFFAHVACIPVALALLFALILSGPVEALHKKGIPRNASAVLILVLVLSAITGIVAVMWTPAQGWYAKTPQTMLLIRQKVRPVAKFMNRVDELRRNATNIGAPQPARRAGAPVPAAAPIETGPGFLLNVTAPAVAGILAFVIITVFLLSGGPPMLARMTAAFVDSLNSSHVLHIIEKVRVEVGHFYLVTTLINLVLGIVTGAAMWAWGMPTPYLWGALAAILNYLPYAGAATTLLIITLVALVSLDTLGHVLGVAGTYLLLTMLEGQVAQPLLVGRRLEVNPLLIFLGLWFGESFWGIPGIVLATPVLVTLKVIAENAEAGTTMMEFLGPNDQTPGRDARLHKLRKFARRSSDRPS
jgi:predicted PurR-regulated permease PerM